MPDDSPPRERINVVVAGAGPAGLLTAIHLLRRNNEKEAKKEYKVTLVDPGVDYGALTLEELQRKRSWVIGLSAHGLSSVRQIPKLYEEYISKIGIPITTQRIKKGEKEFAVIPSEVEGHGVDRNHVVAAMARYLNDHFSSSGEGSVSLFEPNYESKVIFADGERRRVLVRRMAGGNDDKDDSNKEDRYIPYDLLIGCDGVRSCVRSAMLAHHRDFEFSLKGTFGVFKSVHVDMPPDMDDRSMYVLADCLPHHMGGICLPEVGSKLNVIIGHSLADPCPEEMKSTDPNVVRDYVAKNFTSFPLDAQDFAEQWTKQYFSSTGQVHCNFYHSLDLRVVLMGDAAHATSPNIGQGMNTALADAAAFSSLLDLHGDDLDAVLPKFSRERVKEGNALTDLSFHYFSQSTSQFMLIMIQRAVRAFLRKWPPFSSLLSEDPYALVAKGGKLSVCYDALTRSGYLERVRRVNDKICREHFERTTGMVTEEHLTKGMMFGLGATGAFVACAIGVVAIMLRDK